MTRALRSPLTVTVATACMALLGVATAASAGSYERHEWNQRGRHHTAVQVPVPPLPPLPPRLVGMRAVAAIAVPRRILVHEQRRYSPYWAGRVFYAPRARYLDVYYFPVAVGRAVAWEPRYYLDGQIFFGITVGSPRFFLRMGF